MRFEVLHCLVDGVVIGRCDVAGVVGLDGQQCLIGLVMMIKRGGVEHLQHLHRFLASVLGQQRVHGNELLVVGRMATSAHHEQ